MQSGGGPLLRSLSAAALFLLAGCALPGAGGVPEPAAFTDFAVPDVYTGRPAPADLEGVPGAERFGAQVEEGAARGPNFAGRFTVVSWACGTMCVAFAVVDAETGRVVLSPDAASLGLEFRLESRLLVVDPPEAWAEAYGEGSPEGVERRTLYLVWDETGFREVAELRGGG